MSTEQVQFSGGRLAAVVRDPAPLFVYGSLLVPEVLQVLIDRDPNRTPAVVSGWRIVAIKGKLYPGLVRSVDSEATGHLLTDLREQEWRILDAFESKSYDLRSVATVQNGDAWVYALREAEASPEAWDSGAFIRHSLGTYLVSCRRWRRNASVVREAEV